MPFQHSSTENIENQQVEIFLSIKDEHLEFIVRNNLGDKKLNGKSVMRNNTGIGIQNIKRRLELLYPNRHSLTYGAIDNEFQANLVINKKHQ